MSTTATATKWTIDPVHSEISFKVKHLVISTVTGFFKEFEGSAETEGDKFEGSTISFTADVASIDTKQKDRDKHLKSGDFFDAENHPKIKFSGKLNGGKAVGKLTMRGTEKDVTFDVDHGGTVEDPNGNLKAGFEIEGSVNRKEFGLTWDAVTEAGSVVVSDKVRIIANVQLAKQ